MTAQGQKSYTAVLLQLRQLRLKAFFAMPMRPVQAEALALLPEVQSIGDSQEQTKNYQ